MRGITLNLKDASDINFATLKGLVTDTSSRESVIHFVTGGPRNYAYTLMKPNNKGQTSICKVRDITLNFKNALDIKFATLKGLVTGASSRESVKVTDSFKIIRNTDTCYTINKKEQKYYKTVFDKRVLTNDYVSTLYGF